MIKQIFVCDVCKKEYRDKPKTTCDLNVYIKTNDAMAHTILRGELVACSLKCILKSRKQGNENIKQMFSKLFPVLKG